MIINILLSQKRRFNDHYYELLSQKIMIIINDY